MDVHTHIDELIGREVHRCSLIQTNRQTGRLPKEHGADRNSSMTNMKTSAHRRHRDTEDLLGERITNESGKNYSLILNFSTNFLQNFNLF